MIRTENLLYRLQLITIIFISNNPNAGYKEWREAGFFASFHEAQVPERGVALQIKALTRYTRSVLFPIPGFANKFAAGP
jgi:hypothetical protein